jgi:SLT domain-containing protein
VKVSVSPMKNLICLALFSCLLFPKVYAISPEPPKTAIASPSAISASQWHVYTQAGIDELTANTANPTILRELIKCESQNTNVARMDSNHKMSFGVLQFQASTWADFQSLSHIQGSPMNVSSAIEMADWAISNGYLGRWTCAHILHLIK